MDKTFDCYSTMSKTGIPEIPCIDAYQFVNKLRKGQNITDYCGHLLAANRRNYMIIGHVACAFGYNAREIERFNYGTIKDNEYFYFMLEPFDE